MPAPRRASKPDVIEELASHARTRKVIQGVGVGKYYNSAELLIRQANDYRLRGNDPVLYIFLLRYASLVLETLPGHPDFRADDKQYRRLHERVSKDVLPELERAKLRIKLSGTDMSDQKSGRLQYPQAPRPAEAVQTSLTTLPGLDWARFTQPGSHSSSDYSGSYNGSAVPSAPPLDLLSGSGGANGMLPPPPPQQMNLLPFDPRALGAAHRFPAASEEARQRHALLPAAPERRRPAASPPAQRPLYPDIDRSPVSPIDFGIQSARPPASQANGQQQAPSLMDVAPAVAAQQQPPQPSEQLTADLRQQDACNVKPQLELQLGPQEMQVDMVSPTVGQPCSHAPPHPHPLAKKFEGIRDVNVSVSLMEDFMRLCVANTQRNIETIGLLGGSLSADGSAFNINTLIIPKQKGETDRVEMLKEEEIWDIFFEDGPQAQSLFPVGWIHTHPAFDCFLSSVDIHNQYGYQVMLEEAVAIVMSPRDSKNRRCGIFRLTTPGGMDLIKDCSQTGFHTHAPTANGQKIYELCGHVYVNPRVAHKVVDLR